MHADATERFLVRSYEPGDETAILDLFARSFHAPRTLEHWRWKYLHNPHGGRRISLAFERDRLVGHYAGYAVPFRMDDSLLDANQIGDTMTDPSIRHVGRGASSVLGRTALHFYATFCENRVAFNYGFNVANIQKFSLRFLRSDRVEPVAYWYRDLRARPLARLSRLERLARGLRLELVTVAAPEWDTFFERVAPRYGFLVRRDARYVNWRYLQCPDGGYVVVAIRKWRTLVGWVVVRLREDRLTVGDALLDPDHAETFELAIRHLASVYPASALDGWFSNRPFWMRQTVEATFESRPEPQDLSVMCVPFTLGDAVERMRQSLYYTMGDSDLF